MTTPKLTTGEVMQRLKRHYIKPGAPLPGGIFLPEVGWNGGGVRFCDAIYVGFTSTSGRILVGHEVKTSRADWVRELEQTDKADQWADQCHAWYLVVSDPAIVQGDELPPSWGLMAPGTSKTRMTVLTKAERKPLSHTPSWQAVRSIMARQDTLRASAIANVSRDADQRAWAKYQSQVDERSDRLMGADKAHLETLRTNMKRVEDALGAPIDFTDRAYGHHTSVTLKDVAAIASLVRTHRDVRLIAENLFGRYASPTANTRRTLDKLDEALAALKEAHEAHSTERPDV